MKHTPTPYHGWVLLDKPLSLSSQQAVTKVRHLFSRAKAGHAGTLDPLATGLLPIALGEATKLIPYIMDRDKTYEFTVTWGEERTTDDAEGTILKTSNNRPTQEEIVAILPQFIGHIQQIPPIYSAIKVEGRRSYDLARKGEEVSLKARTVTIHTLTLLETPSTSEARFEIACSKGTYVRSLARDLAHALGTVGYISALRRTQVGPFLEKNAVTLTKLLEFQGKSGIERHVNPVDTVLDDILVVTLTIEEMERLRLGQRLPFPEVPFGVSAGDILVCYDSNGQIGALSQWKEGVLHPKRVFNF
jgi:tRNA pseudouridine55 synthase